MAIQTQIQDIITNYCKKISLSIENKEFISIINDPWTFHHSTPGNIGTSSSDNDGETAWQRELYDNSSIWLDIELPVGQRSHDSGGMRDKRLDMVGYDDNQFILCELKKTAGAGNPFDALLQIIAYYLMICQNASKLDDQNIHHTNARNKSFKWVDVVKNCRLMIKANQEYWDNWDTNTPKNEAAKKIISACEEIGLKIQLSR